MLKPATVIGTLAAVIFVAPGFEHRKLCPKEKQDPVAFLFYAVLEGLYDDGVQPEVAKSILAGDAEAIGSATKKDFGSFVAGCRICQPIRDAFNVYVGAPPILRWLKRPPEHGFGKGLPAELVAKLASNDSKVRLPALQDLVQKYVGRRFKALSLSDAERDQLRRDLEHARKEGMAALFANEAQKEDFEERCPSCEGATGSIR